MRTRYAAPALGILLFLAAALAAAEEKRFDQRFTVRPGGTLLLETDAGDVRVTGGKGDEVAVEAVIKGSTRVVNAFDVTAEQAGDEVRVKGVAGKKKSWRFWESDDMNIVFTISVPKQYNVKLMTAGGDVNVREVDGRVTAGTSGGDIVIGAVKGEVTGETSGGDVNASDITGSVALETSGGDVSVVRIAGPVNAETSGGNISVDEVDGKVHVETSGGNIRVGVKGPNRGVHAQTSGGNIDVSVASNVSASLDASTSGGSVVCDVPVTVQGKIDESKIKGTINGGGELIYAHTSGGNVRVRSAGVWPK